MKFDANKGDSGIVFDADGLNVACPISGDTESGVVLCQVRDANGEIMFSGDEMLKETRRYKAPLTIEPLPEVFDGAEWDRNYPAAPYEVIK
jgi:hypothetical protein